MGRDSIVVGIVTFCGLDGSGIESRRGGEEFSAPAQADPGAHPDFRTRVTGSFSPGVKRLGRGLNQPPASSAEVKEKVALYLHSPSGPNGLLYGELYMCVCVCVIQCGDT